METRMEIKRLENEIKRLESKYEKYSEELYDLQEGAEPSLDDILKGYRKIDNIACDYNDIKDKVQDNIEGTLREQFEEIKEGRYKIKEAKEKLDQLGEARIEILHSIRRISREDSDPASTLGFEREYKDVCKETYKWHVKYNELTFKLIDLKENFRKWKKGKIISYLESRKDRDRYEHNY